MNNFPTSIGIKLKPCPWCGDRPEIMMPICRDGTWLWDIRCINDTCKIKPKSPHVSIRKTTKYDFDKMLKKIDTLVSRWNIGLQETRFYPITIYFDKLISKIPS